MLECDVDVVLKGDLVPREPLGVDAALGDVEICEHAGWMATFAVLG